MCDVWQPSSLALYTNQSLFLLELDELLLLLQARLLLLRAQLLSTLTEALKPLKASEPVCYKRSFSDARICNDGHRLQHL
jgi:hypothetical protein